MSLRVSTVIGALMVGTLSSIAVASASSRLPAITAEEELAELMHQHGLRKPIDETRRADLADIRAQAEARSAELDLGCEATGLFEVRLLRDTYQWIAGYQALIECEEAPTPAVAFYYDVNHRFLGTLPISL